MLTTTVLNQLGRGQVGTGDHDLTATAVARTTTSGHWYSNTDS